MKRSEFINIKIKCCMFRDDLNIVELKPLQNAYYDSYTECHCCKRTSQKHKVDAYDNNGGQYHLCRLCYSFLKFGYIEGYIANVDREDVEGLIP